MGNPVLQFQIISKSTEQTAGFYASLFGSFVVWRPA